MRYSDDVGAMTRFAVFAVAAVINMSCAVRPSPEVCGRTNYKSSVSAHRVLDELLTPTYLRDRAKREKLLTPWYFHNQAYETVSVYESSAPTQYRLLWC